MNTKSVVNPETSLAAYYVQRAGEYERIYAKTERQADLKRLRSFVEHAFAGADVLEVACGTGYWTEILARSAASVLATDINEEPMAIARSKRLDLEKVTFQNADAYALPSFPRRFSAGFSGFWWSHIPRCQLRAFLCGFHSVLSPGAKVVFINNVYVGASSTPIARVDEHGDTYQVRRLEDGSTHEVRKNFPTNPELLAAVDGLASEVRIERLKYYWILGYTECTSASLAGEI